MPEEDDKDTAFEKADEVMTAIAKIDAVGYIGAMDAGSSAGLVGGMGVDTQDDYGSFAFYVLPKEDHSSKKQVEDICHTIETDTKENAVHIKAYVKTTGQTGVEMEALHAVSAAALTIYDMCKAIDRSMHITNLRVIEKDGGKSGHFVQD